MKDQDRPLVVIGVGNVLLRDDAIGVRVVEGLRRLQAQGAIALPRATNVVDGGTVLVDLLHAVRDARGVVLVDAVHAGAPVGTVSVQRGDAIVAGDSAHGLPPNSPGELLALARLMGWLPEQVAMVGIEIADTELGTELTPVVAAALPEAMATVRDVLRSMDEQIAARRHGAAAPTRTTGALA